MGLDSKGFKSLSQHVYENDFDCGHRFAVTSFFFAFVKQPNVIYRYVTDFRDPDGDLVYIIQRASGSKFLLTQGRESDEIILHPELFAEVHSPIFFKNQIMSYEPYSK